jgi:hypothetical protein
MVGSQQREDPQVPINEALALMRHESTFLTLDQTAMDLHFQMTYLKTYSYPGSLSIVSTCFAE